MSMVRDGCTCEYCCGIRDEHDDEQLAEEHDLAMHCGKEIFNELKVGDSVEYYRIPWEDRKVVYHSGEFKWKLIEECATHKFQDVVTSKSENRIKLNKNKQRISPAECWCWGMRKI
jgi:hypothetical protein